MIVDTMSESEITHEFAKMKERIVESIDSIVYQNRNKIYKVLKRNDSCIFKPRKFILDNIHFIFATRLILDKDHKTFSSTDIEIFALNIKSKDKKYNYVKIIYDVWNNNSVECMYFTQHFIERISERNGFINEMNLFEKIRKISSYPRRIIESVPIKFKNCFERYNNSIDGYKSIYSRDGMFITNNIIKYNPSKEITNIIITYVSKDLYKPYQRYIYQIGEKTKLIKEHKKDNIYVCDERYFYNIFYLIAISMEKSDDEEISKIAKKLNKKVFYKLIFCTFMDIVRVYETNNIKNDIESSISYYYNEKMIESDNTSTYKNILEKIENVNSWFELNQETKKFILDTIVSRYCLEQTKLASDLCDILLINKKIKR